MENACPRPRLTRSKPSSKSSNSLSLPTNGVKPRSVLTSNLVLLVLGAITLYTLTGLSFPLTLFSPNASKRKSPSVILWVSSVIQVVPGFASPSILEARLTVSPTALNSTLRLLPKVPTTTGPVCIPIRIFKVGMPSLCCFMLSLNFAISR